MFIGIYILVMVIALIMMIVGANKDWDFVAGAGGVLMFISIIGFFLFGAIYTTEERIVLNENEYYLSKQNDGILVDVKGVYYKINTLSAKRFWNQNPKVIFVNRGTYLIDDSKLAGIEHDDYVLIEKGEEKVLKDKKKVVEKGKVEEKDPFKDKKNVTVLNK